MVASVIVGMCLFVQQGRPLELPLNQAETRSGVRCSYVTDGLGSTLALLDNTQTKTDTFDYFPFGAVASRTGTTPTPFQYVGSRGYYQVTIAKAGRDFQNR